MNTKYCLICEAEFEIKNNAKATVTCGEVCSVEHRRLRRIEYRRTTRRRQTVLGRRLAEIEEAKAQGRRPPRTPFYGERSAS